MSNALPNARSLRPSIRHALPLGVATGVVAAVALPTPAPADPLEAASSSQVEITRLRAQGPAVLDTLFARYDQLQPGTEKNALAWQIDKVAAQRYATVSRLYWYTELDKAEDAAKATQRPILALRMLGRLDDELSCANSRLFRSVLYSNAGVSKFLRDHFILYWSSERPVPKVTIDMGDGRTIQRTTTGNSAHYVLDASGNVLDVLPGMYAPAMFQAELEKSLSLAAAVRTRSEAARTSAIRAFHQKAFDQRAAAFAKITKTARFTRGDRSFVSKLARAQRATMSKSVMEMPDLDQFGMDVGKISREDIDQWANLGVQFWDLKPTSLIAAAGMPYTVYRTFDNRSVTLMAWLHDYGQTKSTQPELAQVIGRLEFTVLADTALDELQLRQDIRKKLVAEPGIKLDDLNAWIYAEVFHTPKSDPWLGLVPRTDYTGLPGDGVVTR